MYKKESYDAVKAAIRCVYPIYVTEYDTEYVPLPSDTSDLYLQRIIAYTDCFDIIREHTQTSQMPMIFNDECGFMWAVVFSTDKNGMVDAVTLVGPVFINNNNIAVFQKKFDKLPVKPSARRKIYNLIHSFPVIMSEDFYKLVIMFHYVMRRENISANEFSLHASVVPKWQSVLSDGANETSETPAYGRGQHPNVYRFEQEMIAIVESGDISKSDFLNQMSTISSGIQAGLKNSLQQAKYSSVVLLALCSRAAIRGKAPVNVSYALNAFYTGSIDNCRSLNELTVLNDTMFRDFVTRVHAYKSSQQYSQATRACCDYIDFHIFDKITIHDLAEYSGYSDYYLSRKFKKETGKSINQFILSKKIEMAKNMILTKNQTITKIAEELNFCSQAYFSNVFTSETGMSPTDFKNSNLK